MDEDRHVLQTRADTKLSREQRAGLFFVVVCGLGALVLGGQYLWTHMAAPFAISYTGPRFQTGAEQELERYATQKKTDTDFDGITDYDELYIYKTSPYLNDSDSDGLFDGSEISSGQDPNCAKGETCEAGNAEAIVSGSNPALEAEAAELAARQQALDQAFDALYGLSPAEVRTMLIQSGADPAQVEAMSDEEVTQVYQGILAELEQQGEISKLIPEDLLESATP